jgi:hypothetical protein
MMTLWCIFRSPLIFGGDLPSNDAATTALITNPEVLTVDQHSALNHQSLERGNIRTWLAEATHQEHAESADRYLAVFNLGEADEAVELKWIDVGVAASSAEVRDLWRKKSLGRQSGVKLLLRSHASMLYRISEPR